MARILVIAAHPDDETLGCGGTMRRLVNEGHAVGVRWLGDGLDSRNDVSDEQRDRHRNAKTVALITLGAQSVSFGSLDEMSKPLPDQRFDEIALLDVNKRIETVIEEWQPDTIFTHSAKDLNRDHQIVNQAVITATRPCSTKVKDIYAFEVLSTTEWNFGKAFAPNYFVNITETLTTKVEAIQCYDGELRQPPHPRSLEGIYALATYRGMQSGFMSAEAFEVIRITNP